MIPISIFKISRVFPHSVRNVRFTSIGTSFSAPQAFHSPAHAASLVELNANFD